MALKYNPLNYVPRADEKYYDYINSEIKTTTDIYGSNVDKLTNRYYVNFSAAGSVTLTVDIVLTHISIQANGDSAAASGQVIVSAQINAATVASIRVDYQAGSEITENKEIPIPNWKIKASDILQMAISTGGGGGQGRVAFIGYYL